jgi:hypothetical protein
MGRGLLFGCYSRGSPPALSMLAFAFALLLTANVPAGAEKLEHAAAVE